MYRVRLGVCYTLVIFFVAGVACYGDEPKQESAIKATEKARGEERSEVVEIPLDQVIGARGLRDLEPEFFIYRDTPEKVKYYSTPEGLDELKRILERAEKESLVLPIERTMLKLPTGKNAKPGTGFAVRGRGKDALQGIYDVLVKGDRPTDEFPEGSEITIIFFARPAQPVVGLDRIEIHNGKIGINYELIARAEQSLRWTLALIPCGKLPAGTYDVEMIRSPDRKRGEEQNFFGSVRPGAENRIVCGAFTFKVVEKME